MANGDNPWDAIGHWLSAGALAVLSWFVKDMKRTIEKHTEKIANLEGRNEQRRDDSKHEHGN